MLRSALRDLQWRRRRFAIAIVGAALVFGMTLVITGVSSGFDAEATRTVSQLRADAWLVGQGAAGPFFGSSPIPASRVTTVFGLPGVNKAVDTVFARKEIVSGRHEIDVNVFGAPAGSLGLPLAAHGRSPTKPHDIAISTKLHDYGLGSRIVVAGHPFRVVGTVSDSTALAGAPNVFMTLPDAQQLAFAGQPVASAIAVAGGLRGHAPPGLVVQSPQTAREDLLRVLKQARSSITLMAVLLWVVAAMIIGSVIYLSVLERQKDFAIFKATGVATSSILAGLAVQAIVLSIIAAVLGAGIAILLGPHFPTPVSNTLKANLVLPAIAVVVGFVASLSGLRRAVSVDPALAFGGP